MLPAIPCHPGGCAAFGERTGTVWWLVSQLDMPSATPSQMGFPRPGQLPRQVAVPAAATGDDYVVPAVATMPAPSVLPCG